MTGKDLKSSEGGGTTSASINAGPPQVVVSNEDLRALIAECQLDIANETIAQLQRELTETITKLAGYEKQDNILEQRAMIAETQLAIANETITDLQQQLATATAAAAGANKQFHAASEMMANLILAAEEAKDSSRVAWDTIKTSTTELCESHNARTKLVGHMRNMRSASMKIREDVRLTYASVSRMIVGNPVAGIVRHELGKLWWDVGGSVWKIFHELEKDLKGQTATVPAPNVQKGKVG